MPIFQRHRASENEKKPILRIISTKSDGEQVGRICPLRRGNNIVGRIQEVDVVIKDHLVSRQHACITVNNEQTKFTLQDFNSRNGTRLKDGEKITDKPQPLLPGTIMVFGTTEVALEYEGEQEAGLTMLKTSGKTMRLDLEEKDL
ncbi:MAG: FHA domain-containing protein [Candidatus Sumerlaeota bacterium]|nr:FHA domain-containing protein [Candidatus Sumerlaeota bacterium]